VLRRKYKEGGTHNYKERDGGEIKVRLESSGLTLERGVIKA